jgi:hypothetical protein
MAVGKSVKAITDNENKEPE